MDKVWVLRERCDVMLVYSVPYSDKLNAKMDRHDVTLAHGRVEEVTVMFAMQTEVLNPAFDSVPATLVDLLVTDSGSVTPAYVYRLLQVASARRDGRCALPCGATPRPSHFAVNIPLSRKTSPVRIIPWKTQACSTRQQQHLNLF